MKALEVLELIATVYSADPQCAGPTDKVAEVLEVSIQDAGGNEYGRAKTRRGAERIMRGLRIKTHLVAVKIGRVGTCEEFAYHPDYSLDCGSWVSD